MGHLSVRLNELLDEILIIILRKLYNVDVLYTLIGVNKRLNTIAHDSIFTSHLTLFQRVSNDCIRPLSDRILDRFCLKILPEIHHKILWLHIESTAMERILLATNYPNLYGLSLYGIDVDRAISLCIDDTSFTHVIKNQISSLVIDIIENRQQISRRNANRTLFTHVFTMFNNLQYLNFCPTSMWYQRLLFDISPPTVLSSTLLDLHVCVDYFTDCLYLLDGRFNQLRTFHVNIYRICCSNLTVNNEEKLPNLRCFSLYCNMRTHVYDELIVPLLHRILNLEKLDLHLKVARAKGFLDGNDSKENIINHIPRLKKFSFDIRSLNHFPDEINFRSNEDIQHTFKDLTDSQIISCVDYFRKTIYSQCYIYSYPYRLNFYDNIANTFPGGLFKCVRKVSLYDERPFEHEFFLEIAQSFPFMRELTVINEKPQKNKFHRKSKNDNQDFLAIKYPHLTSLNLSEVHDDYVEQFLVDTEMSLPNNVYLSVMYEVLQRITENFTRTATRINCTRLSSLRLHGEYQIAEHFRDYFPQAKIF